MRISHLFILSVLSGYGFTNLSLAGFPDSKQPVESRDFCDVYEQLFGWADLYRGEGPLLQAFAFHGRYHGQIIHNSSSEPGAAFDDKDTDWINRRFRFGFDARFLSAFQLSARFDLDRTWEDDDSRIPEKGGDSGFFQNLYSAQLTWKATDRVSVWLGKIDPVVTLEESISSKYLLTLERSSMSEMVNHDVAAGMAMAVQEVLGNDLEFGVYNGGRGESLNNPELSGRWGYGIKLNRQLFEAQSSDQAPELGGSLPSVRLGVWYFHVAEAEDDLVHAARAGDTFFEEFTDVWSIHSTTKGTHWGLLTDVLLGSRDDRVDGDGDFTALILVPYYDFTKKHQLVYRFTRGWGKNESSVNALDLSATLGTGDEFESDDFSSHYLGFNHYICGNKLKVMNGLQYSRMEQEGGRERDYWSYQSAIRMYF